jgi:hypothetical protein
MSCTKVFRMGNVRWPADHPNAGAMARFDAELQAALARGAYCSPILTQTSRVQDYVRMKAWQLTDNRHELLSVMSRVLKVNPLDPFDFTRAEREGRQQAWECADALRHFAPGFEEAYLLDTSAQIGLRSSRRLKGRATVTAQDALEFRKYPDSIARASWDIDVWPADSYTAPAVDRECEAYITRHDLLKAGEYFDIRYGCIVAAGVDNLLMAGRCLSAEHVAESSLRIQQTCMATGQAAGTAAALSLQAGVTPADLDPQHVVTQLARDRDIEPAYTELVQHHPA